MTLSVGGALRAAHRVNADVYHFHDPELIPAGLLLRLAGKVVIYDVHEDLASYILSKYYLPSWSRRGLSQAADIVNQVACRILSAIVAATLAIAERFRRWTDKPVVVVQNFPFPDEFSPSPDKRWEDRKAGIAYTGGISERRNIAEIVEAINLIPERCPATLELAGPADSAALRR